MTMKALVKHRAGEGAQLQQVAVPKVLANEVLIRVKNTSICGTDLHIYLWDDWAASRVRPPYVFGHEFSGEVVAIGENVQSVSIGDHVSAESHLVCGHCSACRRGDAHVCQHTQILGVDRTGCFTEYVVLPEENVWKNSKELPFEIASLMEPMGNAVHTVLSGDIVGKSVVVTGCGPIGLMAISIAKVSGAYKVIAIEPSEYRLDLAGKMGATHLVSPTKEDPIKAIQGMTGGEGVDVVLEMSGHPKAIQQGLEMLTPGGRMSILGLPTRAVELNVAGDIVFKGIQVYGIVGRRLYKTWEQTARFLESGRVDLRPLITHRLPLEEYEEGFELMKRGECGKVVFNIER